MSTISELFIGRYKSDLELSEETLSAESGESHGDLFLNRKSLTSSQTSETREKVYLNSVPTILFAQCSRLRNCIQAAASKVEDSSKQRTIKRVSLLTRLIPRRLPQKLSKT